MENHRVFTRSQVVQHKSKKDCWLVINGRVLGVTKFLEEHPGGKEVLMELAGKDATKEFDAIGNSKGAKNLVLKHQVGVLQGATIEEVEGKDHVADTESKNKEMSAFVIKEDPKSMSETFYEFLFQFLLPHSILATDYLPEQTHTFSYLLAHLIQTPLFHFSN